MRTVLTPQSDRSSEAAPASDRPGQAPRWAVGTLSYSFASLCVLFAWLLLGDFAWNMKDRAIAPMSLMMLRGFDAPDWLVGLLVGSIPAGIGLVLGPVIGVLSDRHRGRWGRRIPFILGAAPFILLTMLGLAATPDIGAWLQHRLQLHSGADAVSLRACRIGVFAFFWSVLDIATIVANALFGALINDVVPQILIGRFFALFRCVGLVAGIVVNYWIMGKADDHLKLILAAMGLLYGLFITAMCLMVREGQYPPPPPHLRIKTPAEMMGPVIAYLKECYGNPFFVSFFLATMLGGLALTPVNTFSIYHSRSVHMNDDMYGKCMALSYAFSLLLAYPLGMLADRFHPLHLGLISMALYGLVTGFGFFFAFSANSFFVALLLHTIVAGAYLTGTASIAQRILPRDKFAEISAAGGVIGALVSLFVAPALGLFVEYMHHQYRYMFLLASTLAAATCVSYAVLLRQHNARSADGSERIDDDRISTAE